MPRTRSCSVNSHKRLIKGEILDAPRNAWWSVLSSEPLNRWSQENQGLGRCRQGDHVGVHYGESELSPCRVGPWTEMKEGKKKRTHGAAMSYLEVAKERSCCSGWARKDGLAGGS